MLKKIIFTLWLLASFATAQANIVDTFYFRDTATQERAMALAKVLRCPQCQNQNLLESNSPIATSLRLEVYQMVNAGDSDEHIIQKMRARFGNFVCYEPPFTLATLPLWGLPILLFIGTISYGLWSRRHTSIFPTKNQSSLSPQLRAPLLPVTLLPFRYKLRLTSILLLASGLIYFLTPQFSDFFSGQKRQRATETQLTLAASQKQQIYLELIQNELRQDPNNANKWLELAKAYMQSEDFNAALTCYANAEKLAGSTPQILGLAATAYFYQNHQQMTPKIAQLLQLALDKNPNEISSLSIKAQLAFQQKNYPLAIALWQKILDSDDPNIQRRMLITRIQFAQFISK